MNNNRNKFSRQLTSNENMLLLSVLPENKIGYKSYRDKINTLRVIGSGRFGGGNFILGKEGTIPDLSFPSSPVFALGTNEYKECKIDITVHEEIDNEIEYDISVRNQESIPEILSEIKIWNYSEWNPGDNAPNDNSFVREIIILENKYILVIAPQHKKIWLHEYETGVNHLIPVTNYYNELMRISEIRDTSIALKPASFFENHLKYNDKKLMFAFFNYNRYLKRFNIQNPVTTNSVQPKRKKISFFRKD
jgi:hypothetical protein